MLKARIIPKMITTIMSSIRLKPFSAGGFTQNLHRTSSTHASRVAEPGEHDRDRTHRPNQRISEACKRPRLAIDALARVAHGRVARWQHGLADAGRDGPVNARRG